MNEPDYGSMTLAELRDVERHLDREAYPERLAEVQRQITLREQGIGPVDKEDTPTLPDFSGPDTHAVTFTGSGGEYFRIWIVNLLLSLVTLGIYSAWATVRNRRYLYGNVELDGGRFDFHGSPLTILKGRVIAVVLFAAYAFGGEFHFAIPLVAILILLVGFPWIMVSALRFRLSNTSWKSLRFGFAARPAEAYRFFLVPALVLAAAYAGMIYFAFQGLGNDLPQSNSAFLIWFVVIVAVSAWVIPVLNYRARTLIMNNIYFGDHSFSAALKGSVFFAALFQAVGLGLVVVLVLGIVVVGLFVFLMPILSNPEGSTGLVATMVLFYALSIPIYLLPFALWHVKTTNHVFSSTRIEDTTFHLSMQVLQYWGILVTNAIMAVLSLGLAIPWAKVRMLRYRLGCLRIEGRLSGYTGSRVGSQTATGDEIGQAFDIDFGF